MLLETTISSLATFEITLDKHKGATLAVLVSSVALSQMIVNITLTLTSLTHVDVEANMMLLFLKVGGWGNSQFLRSEMVN